MRRVELMGPPGVGKTTIFNAACALRRAGDFSRYPEIGWRGGGGGAWPEFADFIERAYADLPRSEDIHARRLAVTGRALNRARKIAMADGDGAVLIDEGLCQRGLSLALSQPDRGVIGRYFALVPVPAAVFAVMADIATVKARNVARGHDGAGVDRSPVADACHAACGLAVTQLRERGVPVFAVDAARVAAENAAAILDVVRGLRC